MRFYLPLLLIFVLGTCLRAQSTDVPAPKFSVQQYGKKSFRAAGQRIYVAGFNVHYQTFFSVRDAQAGKRDRAQCNARKKRETTARSGYQFFHINSPLSYSDIGRRKVPKKAK